MRGAWPLPNVWLGVSVETQRYADERIPELLATPAAVRFVSYEPALGPVDFRAYLGERSERTGNTTTWRGRGLDWIIVGGESGTGARPFDAAWAHATVERCSAAGVAVFVKQMGAYVVDRNDVGFEAENEVFADGPDAGKPTNPQAWPTPVDVEHDLDGTATATRAPRFGSTFAAKRAAT